MADVATPTPQYNACLPAWRRIDALWGGTQTMRDAGKEYLPREEGESEIHYQNRLSLSVLFNGTRDAITRISSKPFSRTITLTKWDALDPALALLETDCDRRGTSITQFGRELLEDGLKYGVAHFAVEYPDKFTRKIDAETEEEVSADQARYDEIAAKDLRPYFVRILPRQAIEVSEKRVRVKQTYCEPEGEWGTKDVEQVRVYMPGRWSLYVESEGKYARMGSGTTPMSCLPVVSTYFRRKLDTYSEPTMDDLGWLNVAHWQSSSDQKNLLHVARVPILYEQGVSQSDIDKKVTIGARSTRRTSARPGDSDLKWVEVTGAAIGAGAEDVRELERRMEVLGIQPFIRQSGSSTATEHALDESNVDTDVQSWIRLIESALYRGYELAAEWIGKKLPEEFEIDIWNEFGLSMRAQADATILLSAYTAGLADAKTTLQELQRRGIYSDAVNIDEMISKAEGESAHNVNTMGDEDEIDPDPAPTDDEVNGDREPKAA